jgi:preprotein translocase subunit SecD
MGGYDFGSYRRFRRLASLQRSTIIQLFPIRARTLIVSVLGLSLGASLPLASHASGSSAAGNNMACTSGSASSPHLPEDLAIVRLRLNALGVANARVTRSTRTCLTIVAPTAAQRSGVLIGVLQSGLVAIANGGSRSLGDGERVILVCAVRGCELGVTVGKTNLRARPPTLQIVVSSRHVRKGSAQVKADSNGNPVVEYGLTPQGSRVWCLYTKAHVQRYAAIVANDLVLSYPLIQSAICGSGDTQIVGLSSRVQATLIAAYLNFGALPVPLQIRS